jgi:hypothetical protein
MGDRGRAVLAAAMLWLGAAGAAHAARPAAPQATPSFARGSQAVAQMAAQVTALGDNRGMPFVIIDKVAAEVAVFGADGQLLGVTPALVGSALGDESTPGIGDRELSDIRPEERTTPAGRFVAGYGPARGHRNVLWVDYATAISLHPVVTAHPAEQRLKRLRTPTPEDNRITYGCINVPAAFYRGVVRPAFAGGEGVVYILPETLSLAEAFPTFNAQQAVLEPDAGVDTALEARAPGQAASP